jgi:hypothetical protein
MTRSSLYAPRTDWTSLYAPRTDWTDPYGTRTYVDGIASLYALCDLYGSRSRLTPRYGQARTIIRRA